MRAIAKRKNALLVIKMPKIRRTAIIAGVVLTIVILTTAGYQTANGVNSFDVLRNVSTFFLGFDATDLSSIVRDEIPIIAAVNSSNIAIAARDGAVPAARINVATTFEGDGYVQDMDIYPRDLGEDEFPIETVVAGANTAILINNETNFDIDIDTLLTHELNFDMLASAPTVLILHTHTTEAFTQPGVTWYHISDGKRSHDPSENIIRVGEEFAQVLSEAGIEVVHNTTMHDYPSFNGSYRAALATIEQYKQRYPSIQFVIDIHRDAIIRACGTKIRLLADVGDEYAAQIMFVVGTNAGGLSHDNWRGNLALTAQLQEQILMSHPGLARPINLRRERFNHHATPGSLLIEVGTSGNTLDEALISARLTAAAMAEILNDL